MDNLFSKPEYRNIYDDKKNNNIEGRLLGIKGQYLIFDNDRVFNVRSHQGYIVQFSF